MLGLFLLFEMNECPYQYRLIRMAQIAWFTRTNERLSQLPCFRLMLAVSINRPKI